MLSYVIVVAAMFAAINLIDRSAVRRSGPAGGACGLGGGSCRWVSLLILAALVAAAVLAPWIAPHDPEEQSLLSRLDPPAWMQGGDWSYPLGSDGLGRDVLSNILFGLRISLLTGFVAVAISVAIGAVAGLVAGYRRGWFDTAAMRLVDIQLALPAVLIALAVLAITGRGLWKVIAVIGVVGWAQYARLVRASVLAERQQDYVIAAMLAGASGPRIVFRHLLPNVLGPLLVQISVDIPAGGGAGGVAVVPRTGGGGDHALVGAAGGAGVSVSVQRSLVAFGAAGGCAGGAGAVGEPDRGLGARRIGPTGAARSTHCRDCRAAAAGRMRNC